MGHGLATAIQYKIEKTSKSSDKKKILLREKKQNQVMTGPSAYCGGLWLAALACMQVVLKHLFTFRNVCPLM